MTYSAFLPWVLCLACAPASTPRGDAESDSPDVGRNACGGTSTLEGVPGDSCGNGSAWECDTINTVVCQESERNACGGISTLPETLGDPCGSCGEFACDGPDALFCEDPGLNACGGCQVFSHSVGEACGNCGVLECAPDDNNSLLCVEQAPQNACLGCEPLAQELGSACGTCGAFVCDGTDSLRCEEQSSDNGCGGCVTLDNTLGSTCNGCGIWVCQGTEGTRCDERACMGCLGAATFPLDSITYTYPFEARVQNWPATATLSRVRFWDVGNPYLPNNRTIQLDYNKASVWPDPGDGSVANAWVFFRNGNAWQGQTWDYMRPNQTYKDTINIENFINTARGTKPQQGECLGYMVSGRTRGSAAGDNVHELTNIVFIEWPFRL